MFVAKNRYIFIIFIMFIFVMPSCTSSSSREEKLHLAIENQPTGKEKAGMLITVEFNGKKLADKQKVEAGVPFSVIKSLPRGNNNISITEEETGAVYKSTVNLEGEKWLKVVFYRQSKGMGYFEGKLQDRPFGYEAEKDDKNAQLDGKDKKTREEEIDKKLDDLGKNVKKITPQKKKSK